MKKPLLTTLVIAAAFVVLLALPMVVRSEGENALFLPVIFGGRAGLDTPEPPPPPTPPSSLQLIDDALKAGKITANTAAVYRVYALFYDTRLPVQYRGRADEIADIAPIKEAITRFPSLSPAQQDAVRPYLLRPDDPNSWAYMTSALRDASQFPGGNISPSASTPEPYPTRPAQSHNWVTVTAINGVIVHYQSDVVGDEDKAKGLKAAIDAKIYAGLVDVMDRAWMPDGEGCTADGGSGGNDMLDIYLVHGIADLGLTMECHAQKPSPSWIELNADRDLGDETHIGLVQTTAHEMLHAVQNNFCYLNGNDMPDYLWIEEATATWIMDYIYKDAQAEQKYAKWFLNSPYLSLEDETDKRYYGAYLWPFYLTRVQGMNAGIVREWFTAAESKKSLAAVANEQGTGEATYDLFGDNFNDFVLKNWNHPPLDNYKQLDGLVDSADRNIARYPYYSITRTNAQPMETFGLNHKISHLSAQYYLFSFPDESSRSVAMYNGISRKLYLGPGSIYGDPTTSAYYIDFNEPVPDITGMKVNALVKINGVWQQQDWTDESVVGFCRDRADERVEEMVVIITNSNWKEGETNYEFTPSGELPTVVVSPVGCYHWKGSIDVTYPDGKILQGRDLVLEADRISVVPYKVFEIKSGTLRVKIHYYNQDTFQTFDADQTLTLGGGTETGAIMINNLATGGAHQYGYTGYFQTSLDATGTMSWMDENGQNQTIPYSFDVGRFFHLPNLESPQAFLLTESDHFSGNYTEGGVTYHWDFTLNPDPTGE